MKDYLTMLSAEITVINKKKKMAELSVLFLW